MARSKASGRIRVGIGGWAYAPWRGVFYPKGLKQADELAFAASQLTSIEIFDPFRDKKCFVLQTVSYFRPYALQKICTTVQRLLVQFCTIDGARNCRNIDDACTRVRGVALGCHRRGSTRRGATPLPFAGQLKHPA